MAEGARMPMTSDGTDERTSTSNLPETLAVMTSAQKAWINSGAKKRSLEDIAEEHKEASSSSNLNPVNIKKKKRPMGMLGQQVNDSSVDEAQQREETPWAFAGGEFIQAKQREKIRTPANPEISPDKPKNLLSKQVTSTSTHADTIRQLCGPGEDGIPAKIKACREQFTDSYNAFMNFLNKS